MYWNKNKYVNQYGKIIGEVREVNDEWVAYTCYNVAGRFINLESAKAAVVRYFRGN